MHMQYAWLDVHSDTAAYICNTKAAVHMQQWRTDLNDSIVMLVER